MTIKKLHAHKRTNESPEWDNRSRCICTISSSTKQNICWTSKSLLSKSLFSCYKSLHFVRSIEMIAWCWRQNKNEKRKNRKQTSIAICFYIHYVCLFGEVLECRTLVVFSIRAPKKCGLYAFCISFAGTTELLWLHVAFGLIAIYSISAQAAHIFGEKEEKLNEIECLLLLTSHTSQLNYCYRFVTERHVNECEREKKCLKHFMFTSI